MPNLTGYRILDQDGLPINATNPLSVKFPSDPITVTVSSAVGINTITASGPMNVNISTNTSSVPGIVNVATNTASAPFNAKVVDSSNVVIDSTNPFPVNIADVQPFISTNNSSIVALGSNGVFTGTADITNGYGIIYVSVFSDKGSATNGLSIQQSIDGTNWDHSDEYTIAANTGKTFAINPHARYFRIVYTNGSVAQTKFRLQAIFKIIGLPSSHRVQDSIKDDDDGQLVKSVISGKNPGGTYVNFTATTAGNFKTSLQEYDPAFDTKPLPTIPTDPTTGLKAQVSARQQTPTGNVLQVQIGPGDIISNLPVVQLYDHHQIHEGETWRWSVFVSSLGNGSSKDIQLVVPNITIPVGTNPVVLCPHYRFEVISDSYTNFYLYASPTLTNGTSRTPINQERNGSYTPKLAIYEDPAVTSVGTQIFQGVTFTSKSQGSAADNSQNEFVLKNNTTYLLRVTSGTAGAKVLIRMIWYEDLGV